MPSQNQFPGLQRQLDFGTITYLSLGKQWRGAAKNHGCCGDGLGPWDPVFFVLFFGAGSCKNYI